MAKQQVKLVELKVNSFVTVNNRNLNNVRGGGMTAGTSLCVRTEQTCIPTQV